MISHIPHTTVDLIALCRCNAVNYAYRVERSYTMQQA